MNPGDRKQGKHTLAVNELGHDELKIDLILTYKTKCTATRDQLDTNTSAYDKERASQTNVNNERWQQRKKETTLRPRMAENFDPRSDRKNGKRKSKRKKRIDHD